MLDTFITGINKFKYLKLTAGNFESDLSSVGLYRLYNESMMNKSSHGNNLDKIKHMLDIMLKDQIYKKENIKVMLKAPNSGAFLFSFTS